MGPLWLYMNMDSIKLQFQAEVGNMHDLKFIGILFVLLNSPFACRNCSLI